MGNTEVALFEGREYRAVNTSIEVISFETDKVLRVTKDSTITLVDEPTYALLNDYDLKDGIVEVNLLSKLLPDAPDYARGFIGVAFRINETNSSFEGIYIRPTNGRCDNQNRRNCATQYFSYPEYKFDRLRTESPGKYESYADMSLNEWIHLKIVVNGTHAELFLNNSAYPVLIVNDLKHGSDTTGSIGLWVDVGTEGYFQELKLINL